MAVAPAVFLGEGEHGEASGAPRRVPPLRLVGDDERTSERIEGPLNVLLVEDDAAMRVICAFNLEADGMTVTTAETGQEGVDAARAGSFDLVLLDVMLPDLGGFEVAAEIKDLPIVFISARASSADLAEGRAAGAIDYVTKPFDPVGLPIRLREDLGELRKRGAASVWNLRFGAEPDRAE